MGSVCYKKERRAEFFKTNKKLRLETYKTLVIVVRIGVAKTICPRDRMPRGGLGALVVAGRRPASFNLAKSFSMLWHENGRVRESCIGRFFRIARL